MPNESRSQIDLSLDDFSCVVDRYQTLVRAVARSATGEPALGDEVAQETFLVAGRDRERLRDSRRLRGWLTAIARNLGHRARRRRGLESGPDEAWMDGPGPSDARPWHALARRETRGAVWAALDQLPEHYREPLIRQLADRRSGTRAVSARSNFPRPACRSEPPETGAEHHR